MEVDPGADSRSRQVVELYAKGYRQTAVASEVGISRERVRQILDARGVSRRTLPEQRERDYWLAVEGREAEIEAAFWAVRDFAEAAKTTGIQRSFIERLMKDLWPDVDVFLDVDWGIAKVFSDEDLRQALRDAAASPGMPSPMTVGNYDDWAADAPARPARLTIMVRFAGWRAALLSADLPANFPHRGPGEFTADVCIEAMARCWREIGTAPSMARYGAWQENHADEPGVHTVRSRLRTWTNAKLAAYETVHGKYPPLGQDRSQSQPEPVSPSIGRAYRPRNVRNWHTPSDLYAIDPALLEKQVRSHFELEGRIADEALAQGFVPISPTDSDPQFDVAWRTPQGLTLVEVKSATPDNVESQTRLGIGQILGYAEHLRERGEEVQPALLIELPPAPIWTLVGARTGVVIADPGTMERLFVS